MGVSGDEEIMMAPRFPLQRLSFTKMVGTGRGSGLGEIAHELI